MSSWYYSIHHHTCTKTSAPLFDGGDGFCAPLLAGSYWSFLRQVGVHWCLETSTQTLFDTGELVFFCLKFYESWTQSLMRIKKWLNAFLDEKFKKKKSFWLLKCRIILLPSYNYIYTLHFNQLGLQSTLHSSLYAYIKMHQKK